jgi:hypothetical protein
VLPISKGIAEIRINIQPCKGNNLTTRHTWATKAPRVAIVHDDYQRVVPAPPYPSVVFDAYVSIDTQWVARTLSHYTPVKYGGVSSNSATVEASKFVGLYIARMRQYTTQTCSSGPDDRSLIDSGVATNLELQIYDLDHSLPSHPVFSTFP